MQYASIIASAYMYQHILQAIYRAVNILDHNLTCPEENVVSDFTVHENVLCCVSITSSASNSPLENPFCSCLNTIIIRNYKSINGDRFSECSHHQFDAAPSAMSASDSFDWYDISVTSALNGVAPAEIRSWQVWIRMPWYTTMYTYCKQSETEGRTKMEKIALIRWRSSFLCYCKQRCHLANI